MAYEFYISPSELDLAEQNKISSDTLIKRIRLLGWGKERALTEPCRKRTDLSEWSKIAEGNGISYKTMQRRIERGWSRKDASTIPLIDKSKKMLQMHQTNRKYPLEVVEKALSIGVNYPTFTERMRLGWTLEEASETKVLTRIEISMKGKEASPWSKERRMVGMR